MLRALLSLLLMACILTACGQSGDLYLPPPAKSNTVKTVEK